jgi:RNA polymerase sigma-70 factor, ECF subfamily
VRVLTRWRLASPFTFFSALFLFGTGLGAWAYWSGWALAERLITVFLGVMFPVNPGSASRSAPTARSKTFPGFGCAPSWSSSSTSTTKTRSGVLPRLAQYVRSDGGRQRSYVGERSRATLLQVVVDTYRGVTDDEILRRLADRDRDALHELYDRHAPWLRARLTRRCGDAGLVEEVVQDAFLAVWQKPSAYRGAGDVPAWIWGIGIRRLIAALRRHRPIPWPMTRESATPSAEDEVLLHIEHGDLATAIDGLSPELRAVIQTVVLDGLTSREAARLLRINAATVRTRLMRARHQLRETLI